MFHVKQASRSNQGRRLGASRAEVNVSRETPVFYFPMQKLANTRSSTSSLPTWPVTLRNA